jgi:ethanolamine ammonia-lyase small subunit
MSTRRLMEELRGRLRTGQRVAAPSSASEPAPRRAISAPAPASPLRAQSSAPPQLAEGPAPPRPPTAQDPALLEELKGSTPAKVGVGRAGLRYRTQTVLQFLTDFAVAKAAVESQVPEGWPEQHGLLPLQSEAADPEQFLARPDLGRRLSEASLAAVRERCVQAPDVQVVVADGLSATAVMQNAPPMLASLVPELERRGLKVGTPVFVRHGRAKQLDAIGQAVEAKVGMILIGERPGLGTGDGMSAYLAFEPCDTRTDAEKQAISNIHRRGMLPEEAGPFAARLIEAILAQRTSGVSLDVSGIEVPQSQDRARVNQAHPEPLAGCGQSHGQQCDQARNGLPGQVCSRSDDRPCEACAH